MTTTQTLTDEQWALTDRITEALAARPEESFTPSQIARLRGVRATAAQVHGVLGFLVDGEYIALAEDRGAWSRYAARRPGHYNNL